MKKITCFLGLLFASIAGGSQWSLGSEADFQYRIVPCSTWVYEPDIQGWVCNRVDRFGVTVVEKRDYDRDISELERRIGDLEQKIARLSAALKAAQQAD